MNGKIKEQRRNVKRSVAFILATMMMLTSIAMYSSTTVEATLTSGASGYLNTSDFLTSMSSMVPGFDFGTTSTHGSTNLAYISNSPRMTVSQSSQQNAANGAPFAFNGLRGTPISNGIGANQSWVNSGNDRGNHTPNAQTGIGLDLGEIRQFDTVVVIAGNGGAGLQPTVARDITVRYSTSLADYTSLPIATAPAAQNAGRWGTTAGTWQTLGTYTVTPNQRNSVFVFQLNEPVAARYFHIALTSLNSTALSINAFEIYNTRDSSGPTAYSTTSDFLRAMNASFPGFDFGTTAAHGVTNLAHISNSPHMTVSQSSQQNAANGAVFAFNGLRGAPTMNGTDANQSWVNSANDRGNNIPNAQTGIGIDLGESRLFDTVVVIAGNGGAGLQSVVASDLTVRYSTSAADYTSLPVATAPTIANAGHWGTITGTWRTLGTYTVTANQRNSVFVFQLENPVRAQYFHIALTSLNGTALSINAFEIYNTRTQTIQNPMAGSIDYSIWQLQSPNFRNVNDDRTRQQMISRQFNDWWFRDRDTGFDTFAVPSHGVSTGSATSIRTELRELLPGSLNTSAYQAAWRSSGFHRMEVTYIVQQLGNQPTSIAAMTNGATSIGQVWGTNSSMFELAVNNDGTFVVRPPVQGGRWTRLVGVYYEMGVPFTAVYEVIGDILRLFINGEVAFTHIGMPNTYYFKAGNYDKSTLTTGLIGRELYSSILIGSLEVQHNPIRGRLTLNGEPLANQTVNYTMTGGGLPSQFNGTVTTDENGYYTILNVPSQAAGDRTAQVVITPPSLAAVGATSVNRTSHTVASVSAIGITGMRDVGNDFEFRR